MPAAGFSGFSGFSACGEGESACGRGRECTSLTQRSTQGGRGIAPTSTRNFAKQNEVHGGKGAPCGLATRGRAKGSTSDRTLRSKLNRVPATRVGRESSGKVDDWTSGSAGCADQPEPTASTPRREPKGRLGTEIRRSRMNSVATTRRSRGVADRVQGEAGNARRRKNPRTRKSKPQAASPEFLLVNPVFPVYNKEWRFVRRRFETRESR